MNFIQLRSGPIVREDSIMLALALEDAGHTLTLRGEALEVAPKVKSVALRHELTKDNVRRHVVAFLLYCRTAPEPR